MTKFIKLIIAGDGVNYSMLVNRDDIDYVKYSLEHNQYHLKLKTYHKNVLIVLDEESDLIKKLNS